MKYMMMYISMLVKLKTVCIINANTAFAECAPGSSIVVLAISAYMSLSSLGIAFHIYHTYLDMTLTGRIIMK